jgi:hypothetical protein
MKEERCCGIESLSGKITIFSPRLRASFRKCAGSNHVRHSPDATRAQRRSHLGKSGLDYGLDVPPLYSQPALDFENGIAVEKMRLYDGANIGR